MNLSVDQDQVFEMVRYLNFPDIPGILKKSLLELQEEEKKLLAMKSEEEIKQSLYGSGLFAKKKELLTKHLHLISELDSIIRTKNLIDISLLQQELATQQNHSSALAVNTLTPSFSFILIL